MDENLIICDEYVTGVGEKSGRQGESLESIYDRYIEILNEVGKAAVVSGEVSLALDEFISCAKTLQGEIKSISVNMKRVCNCMIECIDREDQYLF